jgi:hypothetical protein
MLGHDRERVTAMNKIITSLLTLLFLSACSTQQPIHNISTSPIPLRTNGSMLTVEEVKKAIFAAANFKGWTPTSIDDDTVGAEITVRNRHSATVDINYSDRNYNITLKSSVGLDERTGMIHRNYNKWVMLLDQQIQTELLEEATK